MTALFNVQRVSSLFCPLTGSNASEMGWSLDVVRLWNFGWSLWHLETPDEYSEYMDVKAAPGDSYKAATIIIILYVYEVEHLPCLYVIRRFWVQGHCRQVQAGCRVGEERRAWQRGDFCKWSRPCSGGYSFLNLFMLLGFLKPCQYTITYSCLSSLHWPIYSRSFQPLCHP